MRLNSPISLKTKLIAAVTVIVVIVLSAVGQALVAVSRSDAVVSEAMLRRLPEALLVAELTRQTEAVLSAGRELAAARGDFDREDIMFVMQERLVALDTTIAKLHGNTNPSPNLQRLEDNLDLFRTQVQGLGSASADNQHLESRLKDLTRDLHSSRDRMSEKASPLTEASDEALYASAFAILTADLPTLPTRAEQYSTLARHLSQGPERNSTRALPFLNTLLLGSDGIVETRQALQLSHQKVITAVRKVDSQAQRLAAISGDYHKEISVQIRDVVQQMNTATTSNNRMLVIVAVIAVIAVAILGYYLEVRVLSRLLRLRQAIDHFGTDRTFDPAVGGNDEIGGIARAFLQLAREVSSRETQLVEIAHRDPLTGLANRRRFLERFEMVSRRRRPGDTAIALLVIDIDHFKSVNDRYGHLIGDECLRQIARIIEGAIRGTDLVARFGGEEFLVLCTDVDSQGAAVVAEKIRAAVEKNGISTPDQKDPIKITISIGVATVPTDSQRPNIDFDSMMEAADAAVYDAQNSGRNCIRIAPENTAA